MKRFKGANLKKRILSAALALGMVITMISTADWSGVAKAAASSGKGSDETINYLEGANALRTRAVLDKLPIPEDVKTDEEYAAWLEGWRGKTKGTVDRPFVVLELVPYYEQGNFGWLIDGCEPVDVDRMRGNTTIMSSIEWLESQGFFNVTLIDYKTVFFPDEMEGEREFYVENGTYRFSTAEWGAMKHDDIADFDASLTGIEGYYETVKLGEGKFRVVAGEDGSLEIVKANNGVAGEDGNLVWHTTQNKYVKDEWTRTGYTLQKYQTLDKIPVADQNTFFYDYLKMGEIGARYYTTRTPKDTDEYLIIPANCMYSYQSNDVFVKDTLGKNIKYNESKKNTSCQEYSVWIKTITPKELNEDPRWVDIADLVFVTRYNQTTAIADLYKEQDAGGKYYNRLNASPCANAFVQDNSTFGGTYSNSGDYTGYSKDDKKDISWTVTKKLLERVSASKNYIGLVFDKTVRDSKAANTKSVKYYRYDLNDVRQGTDSFDQTGYKDNIFKLWMICTSAKPNLVMRFYVNSGKIVEKDGFYGAFKDKINRTADEQMYWAAPSVFCATENYASIPLNQIDAQSTYWQDYCGYFNQTAYVSYVEGHTYTYNGNQSIFQSYETGSVGADVSHFTSYNHYLNTNAMTQQIWNNLASQGIYSGSYSSVNSNTAPPWTAIRYILELDSDEDYLTDGLRVLDVEPSVAVDSSYNSVWTLTENEIALMVPSIAADADIVFDRYIMGAFVGTFADLNTTYDLIYIGEDAGGFWTGAETSKYANSGNDWANDPANAGADRTNFIDNSMDGLVYFHIGDKFKLDYWKAPARFLYDYDRVAAKNFTYDAGNAHIVDTSDFTRQTGNDLTEVKKKALVEYVKAGYPIVAADHLYDTSDHPYVDKSSECILWNFLSNNKATLGTDGSYGNGVLMKTQAGEIDKKVKLRRSMKMEITGWPAEYSFDNNNAATKVYVPKEGNYGRLDFEMKVPNTSGYSYRIYLDQDRNSKFTSGEIVQAGAVDTLTKSVKTYVTDGWVGFIQWRIEVFKTDNPSARVAREGCSAIAANPEGKNKIIALQILPNSGTITANLSNYNGAQDMTLYNNEGIVRGTKKNNSAWNPLYDKVSDFEIEVYAIKMSEFESFFREGATGTGASYGFTYDMSSPIDISEDSLNTNPNKTILDKIEKMEEHDTLRTTKLGGHKLSDFNMIILGFADSYGSTDISNKYGCAEYLFYFADRGKSILFTHDLTSYRNGDGNIAGYTATTMLRDIMGMNKYGIVSSRLISETSADLNYNADKTSRLAKAIAGYNDNQGIPFEKTSKIERHAYTYMNLAVRIGNSSNANSGAKQRRLEYKYSTLYRKSDGNYGEVAGNYIKTGGANVSSGSNSNGSLGISNRALRLNKGQITEYPFQIPEVLTIAETHAQYFQLNMEDPQLTVWYTIVDSVTHGGGNKSLHQLYSCMPQDASNTYYIYSKGNIFYTGVGHSSIDSTIDERRLFVNTLIAAYRPQAQEPEIIITNTEAVRTGSKYTIRIDQIFDYDEDTGTLSVDYLGGDDYMAITFIPRDYSASPTLKCRIYYEGEGQFYGAAGEFAIYKVKIVDGEKTEGERVTLAAEGLPNTYILNTEQEYMIYYKKSRMGDGSNWNHIYFEAKNDKSDDVGLSELFVRPKPMFILD